MSQQGTPSILSSSSDTDGSDSDVDVIDVKDERKLHVVDDDLLSDSQQFDDSRKENRKRKKQQQEEEEERVRQLQGDDGVANSSDSDHSSDGLTLDVGATSGGKKSFRRLKKRHKTNQESSSLQQTLRGQLFGSDDDQHASNDNETPLLDDDDLFPNLAESTTSHHHTSSNATSTPHLTNDDRAQRTLVESSSSSEDFSDESDEFEGFIELTAEEKAQRKAARKARKRAGSRFGSSHIAATNYQRQKAADIFGDDFDEFVDIFEPGLGGDRSPGSLDDDDQGGGWSDLSDFDSDFSEDDDDERGGRRRRGKQKRRQQKATTSTVMIGGRPISKEKMGQLEPSLVKEKFLTEKDERIRTTDIPERLQGHCIGREKPTDTELDAEAKWIKERYFDANLIAAASSSADAASSTDPISTGGGVVVSAKTIKTMLEFIYHKHYEVPFLYTYRKEYFQLEMKPTHFWKIMEWDRKWYRLQLRKKRLLGLIETSRNLIESPDELVSAVHEETGIDEFNDFFDATKLELKVVHGHDAVAYQEQQAIAAGLPKPPVRRDYYFTCLRAGLKTCASQFGITPKQFSQNMLDQTTTHQPQDPSVPPLELAEGYIRPGFSKPDTVLRACRHILAKEIAFDPVFRQTVRNAFRERAVVNTKPTNVGKRTITSTTHPFAAYKRLSEKPLDTFRNSALLELKKAESKGLIEVEITVPQQHHSVYILPELEPLYCSDKTDALAGQWNEQRRMILDDALQKHLYPILAKELELSEVAKARQWLAERCANELDTLIQTRPMTVLDTYDLSDQMDYSADGHPPATQRFHSPALHTSTAYVLALTWGDINEPSYAVVLNQHGMPIEQCKLDFLRNYSNSVSAVHRQRKVEALTRLSELIERHRPDIIVIGASADLEVRRLEVDIRNEVLYRLPDIMLSWHEAHRKSKQDYSDSEPSSDESDFSSDDSDDDYHDGGSRRRTRRRRKRTHHKKSSSSSSKQKRPKHIFSFRSIPVIFADPRIAKINRNSTMYEWEWPTTSAIARETISLGRFVQDPLIEATTLCTPGKSAPEIVSLDLHAQQDLVSKKERYRAFKRRIIDMVAAVGIELNRTIQYKHCHYALQFAPGLGPRKASKILPVVPRHQYFAARDALLSSGQYMGRVVFKNLAGFVRITPTYLPSASLWDGFDYTRIHPEDYSIARKMVADALEVSDKDVRLQLEYAFLYHNVSFEGLSSLDLDTFAREYENQYGRKIFETLYLIKNELLSPFADNTRHKPRIMPQTQLFTLLTGENNETLYRGQIIQATAVAVTKNNVVAKLDCGLISRIPISQITDDPINECREVVSKGQSLQCRVLDVKPEEFEVSLSTRGRELADTDGYWKDELLKRSPPDPYLLPEPPKRRVGGGGANMSAIDTARREQRRRMMRKVDHPNFRPMNFPEVEEYLIDKPVDEVVIRPSSKGPNHLTLSWKFHEDLNVHIDIVEKSKSSNASVGKMLMIGRERFEDLDEILAKYVEPMGVYADLLRSHRAFRPGQKGEIDRQLGEDKAENPQKIPYFLSVAYEKAGKFMLNYMPFADKPPVHEYIFITPRGFKFRNQRFTDPEKMLAWFKRHWQEVFKAPTRSSTNMPRPSQRTYNNNPMPNVQQVPQQSNTTTYQGLSTTAGGYQYQPPSYQQQSTTQHY